MNGKQALEYVRKNIPDAGGPGKTRLILSIDEGRAFQFTAVYANLFHPDVHALVSVADRAGAKLSTFVNSHGQIEVVFVCDAGEKTC